jgi:hypothetical protein
MEKFIIMNVHDVTPKTPKIILNFFPTCFSWCMKPCFKMIILILNYYYEIMSIYYTYYYYLKHGLSKF